jgi:uncharacterized protein YndB with AHSA1/START domain
MNAYKASAQVSIKAPVSRVWEWLTRPELITQYLFGTEVSTDWKEGSPIRYRGVWEGRAYEDKGTILKIEPEKYLLTTYLSAFSGLPDIPENYNTVVYRLESRAGDTTLTRTQDNIGSEESAKHSSQNWEMVLRKMKELIES